MLTTKELKEHWKQMDRDRDNNRKIAQEKGVKIWIWDEMVKEYDRTGQDCNYVPLHLVGKPHYLVSPTYDGSRDGEYIKLSDLKTRKVKDV